MQKRVYVFIDASNLWETQKVRGKLFDMDKLKKFIIKKYECIDTKFFYYTAYPKNGTRDFSVEGKHKFYTFLSKQLNFSVVKKPLKQIKIKIGDEYFVQEKGNMDVEMTIDMIHNLNQYDIAILFSGDSDFLPIVTYLKNKNKKVYVFSSKNNVSQELRTGATGYMDILKIEEDIWNTDLIYKNQKNK